jgi:hypothetical protein
MRDHCLADINDIKWQLTVSGATAENQARAVRSREVEAAAHDRKLAGHLHLDVGIDHGLSLTSA